MGRPIAELQAELLCTALGPSSDACDLDGDESPTPTANAANSAAAWGEAAAVEEYSYDAWSGARWSD